MADLSIRGLDDEEARLLKRVARKTGKSVNAQVIEFVRQGLGLTGRPQGRPPYDDLDHLAGTWTQEEADEFVQGTAAFEKVDEDLWR
jgi:hypothetical protein